MGLQSMNMASQYHSKDDVDSRDMHESSGSDLEGGSGSDVTAPTTLMFRYMPRKFTSMELLEEACKFVDIATIDFVYVPWNKGSKNNLGYGFLNVTTTLGAANLLSTMQGALWSHDARHRSIVVVPARVQGLESNLARFLQRFTKESDECQNQSGSQDRVGRPSFDLDSAKQKLLHQPQVLQNGRPLDFRATFLDGLDSARPRADSSCKERKSSFESADVTPASKLVPGHRGARRMACPGPTPSVDLTPEATANAKMSCVSASSGASPNSGCPFSDSASEPVWSKCPSSNSSNDAEAKYLPSFSNVATSPGDVFQSSSHPEKSGTSSNPSPASWFSSEFSDLGRPPLPLYLVWNGKNGLATSHHKGCSFQQPSPVSIQRAAYTMSATAAGLPQCRWQL